MPQWYNDLYVYDGKLGFERKEVYQRIVRIRQENPNAYKILILGDSVTQLVKYSDYFKELLLKRYPHEKIEVINAGVMGYDTELEYRYLKYRGLDLDPDLVIVQFCVNDFQGVPLVVKGSSRRWVAFDSHNRFLTKFINTRLMEVSRLYEFSVLATLSIANLAAPQKDNVKVPLQKINAMLKEKDIAFYFLIFPYLGSDAYGKERYGVMIEIVKELGLEANTLDLSLAFSRKSAVDVQQDSIHPSDEGNLIAAEALLEKLAPYLDTVLR